MGLKDPWHKIQMRVTAVSLKSYLAFPTEETRLTLSQLNIAPVLIPIAKVFDVSYSSCILSYEHTGFV